MLDFFATLCHNMKSKLVNLFFGDGGGIIRKLSQKQKKWHDRQSRKILLKKSKEKKIRKKHGLYEYCQNNNISEKGKRVIKHKRNEPHFHAPQIFSIEHNPEETIQFYNKILTYREKHKFGTLFFIDSSEVTEVTVDALMYLIAIINDTKFNSKYHYKFKGTFPKSNTAREVYIQSGFMDYVTAKNKQDIRPQTNTIQIRKGSRVDASIAGQVCKFVQDNCGYSRIGTIPLYNILVELMGNTIQHAYKKETKKSANFWFLFAEEKTNGVNFVFLDTGLGIPTTVQKNWCEKVFFFNKDCEFIRSALEGEFRTQTREEYRGKGLPQISQCFHSGLLKNVFVYSGKGCCTLNKLGSKYIINDFKNKIFGTLFCWQIEKE